MGPQKIAPLSFKVLKKKYSSTSDFATNAGRRNGKILGLLHEAESKMAPLLARLATAHNRLHLTILAGELPGREAAGHEQDGSKMSVTLRLLRSNVRYDFALGCRELSEADPRMARLIAAAGAFKLRVKSSHSPFEALLESIIYQQLHGKAAAAILGRLLNLFGDLHPSPEHILATPEERLRAAGVSRGKILALRDLAAKTLDGTVPTLARIRRMSDEDILEHLTQVRGIGPWTVEMLLIFRLGRPDVLPLTDYGVRKGYALTYARIAKNKPFSNDLLPRPEEMLRRAERWHPWRSVASWYLWRACDLAGKPSPPPA
jgi:DNA-3-methyladenine glycosylase II